MPSYKTLYTKSQTRVEKLTDLLLAASEKQNVLIEEITQRSAIIAQLESKLSAVTTELADTKVKLAELALTTKNKKATGTAAA